MQGHNGPASKTIAAHQLWTCRTSSCDFRICWQHLFTINTGVTSKLVFKRSIRLRCRSCIRRSGGVGNSCRRLVSTSSDLIADQSWLSCSALSSDRSSSCACAGIQCLRYCTVKNYCHIQVDESHSVLLGPLTSRADAHLGWKTNPHGRHDHCLCQCNRHCRTCSAAHRVKMYK